MAVSMETRTANGVDMSDTRFVEVVHQVVVQLLDGSPMNDALQSAGANGPEVMSELMANYGYSASDFTEVPAWARGHSGV